MESGPRVEKGFFFSPLKAFAAKARGFSSYGFNTQIFLEKNKSIVSSLQT